MSTERQTDNRHTCRTSRIMRYAPAL